MVGTRIWRGTPEAASAYTSTSRRSMSWSGGRSSTLSTKSADLPTTRPARTWKTCTAASSSSSARASTSRSSGRSSSICRTASAVRTASSLSRRAPARSKSSAVAASRMALSSCRSSGPVSPPRKVARSATSPVVLLVGHLTHAWARAPLDVEQQARAPQALVVPELGVRARPDGKGPQQEVEGAPDGPDVRVGPEVADTGALAAPDDRRFRPLVVDGECQPRIALVILQADVEPGLELLDEVVLEEQRLGLGPDDHPLDMVGRFDHLGRPGGQVDGILEVGFDPRPQ